jgi:hypothetical protein
VGRAMSLTIDTIAEKLLRNEVMYQAKLLMGKVAPEDMTAVELLGIIAIVRGAAARMDARQPSPPASGPGTRPAAEGCAQNAASESRCLRTRCRRWQMY